MPRRLTGFTPSGDLHIGNYFGAIAPIVARQADAGTVVFITDLHALTLEHDPALVRRRTLEFATLLLAAGVDPTACLLVVQSHVPEHTELHYLLECVTGYGEASRMIQFKEKSRRQERVRLSLLTYPVLMAADILLYDTDEVPVGEDQRQHVELARDLAQRFNSRYAPVFTVPTAVNPPVAARIMDLASPTGKMSKSAPSPAGVLRLLDPPDVLRRKVMRAVTDPGTTVAYDPDAKPGVSNLLAILSACTGTGPHELATGFGGYRELKQAVADAVVATVAPVQRRYHDLARHPEHVREILRAGAERARDLAAAKVRAAKEAIGLMPA
ncbi:tryptophan--tRNA ligase 1 [Thermobispora bispora]|uniref:Tryptophan--tRNA ligase n=1 Tax=Thermobispora bispora (strain ATCC 19993 / DSM 43833 / CBS 139.67 / JCM 10125 / KCTC 9307 / NBRC 14880 / R51) TaxID=469371 RepID=D6Y869_THEBD|nr:tryptophan--tRNA ligase [Thermobispora bispora]ADG89805.1 tryptophanyl-tRNA synthetase [Thermobispora bispora DSM 43833]MBO2473934.1 tryptophan--tRNA ligase [Actinomycetales bacterium]MBX6166347.1 tryptophan--tRNA ligase [Thermobispora bispora]QSI49389.1 tryptophan--tRNA ligase [Thermobispora bispora]